MVTIRTALVDVLLHLEINIGAADVGGGSQHLGDIIFLENKAV